MALRPLHDGATQRRTAVSGLGFALQAIFGDRGAVAHEALLRTAAGTTPAALAQLLCPAARPHFTAYTLTWAVATLRARPELSGIAVNLSPDQLLDDDALEPLQRLERVVLNRLEVEVTEQAVSDQELLADRTRRLHGLGVRVHLDDIVPESWPDLDADLPLTGIKLDLAYVRRLVDDPRAQLDGSVRIGELRAAGLDVTAEGVASYDHARLLRDLGCTRFQGYGLARPLLLD